MAKKIGIILPLTLGLLSAFGPFITDLYLPALPVMNDYFRTSPSMVQLSLTTSVIGLAVGQVFIGPLSDKYGRKRLLLGSLVLFCVATVFCIFSRDIWTFNIWRVFQGLGGAGGIVLSKSISTDMFTGKELAKFMAILGAINGITPVLGPVVSGVILQFTTWQGSFVLVLMIAVILLVLSALMKETLPVEKRERKSISHSFQNLFKVFQNRRYVLSLITLACCFFMFFAYVSASPFILQEAPYKLSPLMYSFCFGLNTIAIAVGAAMFPYFKKPQHCLLAGGVLMLFSALWIAACLMLQLPVWLLITAFTLLLFGFGLLQTPTTTIAMDAERSNAGSAAAVLGSCSFLAGGLISPLVSIGEVAVTTSLIMVVIAVLILLMTWRLGKNISVSQS